MGRQRSAEIQESFNRLYELEKGLEKPLDVKRVRMLRLLKQNPHQSLADVADAIGQGRSTVDRWWGEYLQGGMNQLLKIGTRGGNRASRLNQQQLKSLAARVERGDLTTYQQLQGWINAEFDQNYSVEGVRYLVTTKIGREQKQGVQKTASKRQTVDSSLLNERFLQFLNTLPIAGDSTPWVREFQRMLTELFPDVDKVLVAVNYQFDLLNIDVVKQNPVQVLISQHSKLNSMSEQITSVESEVVGGGHASRILEMMGTNGFPLAQFHAPHSFEYYYHEMYAGVIILFREINRSEISQGTLEAIQLLQPFITFIFAHLVMRSRFFNPTNPLFYNSLESLLSEAKLSNQQLRIVTHLLLGRSYKDIADLMEIAEGTVKKQINTIYQKTGTRGYNELFAKYFAPQLAG